MRKVVRVKVLGDTPYMVSEQPQDFIASGNYGRVVRAYNKTDSSKHYVAKIFQLDNLKSYKSGLQELRVISKLPRNQHLVNYEKIKLTSKHCMYIIMEYCEGGTLRNYINRVAVIPEADIWKFIRDFLIGYRCLFDINVVHRDIKTDNILIQNGQFKIADFGLSKIIEEKSKVLSAKGSPVFMAPELLGKGQATNKVDAYSFGVTIYYMAFHKYPYTTKLKYTTLESLFQDIENSPLILPPGRSEQLKTLLSRLLEKDPENRMSWPSIFSEYQYLEMTGLTTISQLSVSYLLDTVELKAIQNSDTEMRDLELLDEDLKKSLRPESVVFLSELEKTLLTKRVLAVYMDKIKGKLRQFQQNKDVSRFKQLITLFNWTLIQQMSAQFDGTLGLLNRRDHQHFTQSKNCKSVIKLIRQDKHEVSSQLSDLNLKQANYTLKEIKLRLYDLCSTVIELLIKNDCLKTAVYVEQIERYINQDPEGVLTQVSKDIDSVDSFINWIEMDSTLKDLKQMLSQNYKYLLM